MTGGNVDVGAIAERHAGLEKSSTAQKIRDLTGEEFHARYGADRLTTTVLRNKFQYVVQHTATDLLNTAFSFILREWFDFAVTISGPRSLDYPMPAVSNSLLYFLGTMEVAVRNTVEEYGVENLQPGDVLIANDPYRVGNHPNDVCLVRPIFHDSAEEPVAFLTLRAHMVDVGGVVAGGFSATKRNAYENGLVLSPRLIYREEKPVKETYDLIFDNTRFGALMQLDLTGIHQALRWGERQLLAAIDRYELDAYLGAMTYACDLGAETMRSAIEQLPDGDYHGEHTLDCDGVDDSQEYTASVTVKIRGHRVEVDLSGTSRQARTSINGGPLDARTATAVALKLLLDPASPFTSGTLRDVDLVIPDGTIVSALPPNGAIFCYWEPAHLVFAAVGKALAAPLGAAAIGGDYGSLSVHNANGVSPDGTPWVSAATAGGEHGPWPATAAGDGESYMTPTLTNNIDFSTEAFEAEAPMVLLRKDYAPDSGGPGKHRGGVSSVRDSLWLQPTEHHVMPLEFKRPSGYGVYGGKEGALGGVWLWDSEAFDIRHAGMIPGLGPETYKDATPVAGVMDPQTKLQDPENGEFFYFARVPAWETGPGAVWRYMTNGAGGWGDPLERDAADVLRDVRDGYVSVEGAARDYGVVILGDPEVDPEGLRIDHESTQRLRQDEAKDAREHSE
jgi:N-methylhydantoinase B